MNEGKVIQGLLSDFMLLLELNDLELHQEGKENIEIVYAIIDRLTPVKPEYAGDFAYCPHCRREYEYGYGNWGDKVCPDCGQSLDWGN